ncbi:MAG: AAA domain-containing protein [Proteobacteria bacterium]|nr:AAA domain-containing protein [Pseudomonadota bacterium]NIS70145.1 AAA domain-containing protein [Pseudomonadota bacterium]
MKHILVASDNQEACDAIRACFGDEYRIEMASSKDSCLEMFRKKRYEFTFIDVEFLTATPHQVGKNDYRTGLQPFWQAFPAAEIIVMSSQEMIREAVMAVKAGASNYLTYPIDKEEARYIVQSLYESARAQSELEFLRDRFWQAESLEMVQSNSPIMREIFDKIQAVAPTKSTVLLTGETGTGKGVLAKLIHNHSHRRNRQFISIHCGAIPDTLLESELFGHEKGAFTGAIKRKLGKFEIAHGGTIFLDEIGTLTSSAQIKLLQVLQEKSFQRVGGEATIEVDVRIIAATNMDLKKMTDEGLFRNDLYYRLSVFPIEIPPLKQRIEDIPIICRHILDDLNRLHAKGIRDIDPQVLHAFAEYPWPGNIRELENLIERAYILETSSTLRPESFPAELFVSGYRPAPGPVDRSHTLEEVRGQAIEEIERRYLRELLAIHGGRINRSAEAAGISIRQLHNLMKKHGLRKEEFKTRSYR